MMLRCPHVNTDFSLFCDDIKNNYKNKKQPNVNEWHKLFKKYELLFCENKLPCENYMLREQIICQHITSELMTKQNNS